MNIDGIVEYKGINYIAYTFIENSYFYETGYKVLRANQNQGYIPCNYFMFNGRISLLYNIEDRNTLNSVAKTFSPNAFANLIVNIIDSVLDMKNNGFISIECISFDASNIFVDVSELKPYFIYVPVNIQSSADGFLTMGNYLRQNLIYIIQNNDNLNSDMILQIVYELSDFSKSLIEVKNKILSIMHISSDENILASKREKSFVQEWQTNTYTEKQSGKLKKIKAEKKKSGKSDETINSYGTTVLKGEFIPSISLIGIDTPEAIHMVIDKNNFIIGHKDDADGYIGFNTSVSRNHCKIINQNGKNYIVDLNSANGTWLNGKRIISEKELEITPGDRIKVSNVEFLVSAANKSRGIVNG